MVEIRLGGRTHVLRFRTHEIALLEERLNKCGITLTVPEVLEQQKIGMVFIREALLVGVAHEFVGKKGKEARLSTQLIGRWLDDCGEDGNAEFDEVAQAVIEAVVLGLPGGQKAMDEQKAEQEKMKRETAMLTAGRDDDAIDVEPGEVSQNPLTGTGTSGDSGSIGKNLSSRPVPSV